MKKIILLVVSCLFSATAFSQEIEWQNTIGSNDWDEVDCIDQTSDGGYILGATSPSHIWCDKIEDNMGGKDYWLIKLDSAGNIQWQNVIGGSMTDWLYYVEQTTDGGYFLAGYSNSPLSGDKTETTNGGYDYWVVKTDAAGIIQWQNTIGGNGDDDLWKAMQTADGGYILGGGSSSGISGDKTEDTIGSTDFWVVKLDASGVVQWDNTIGGTDFDFIYSIEQTIDGGYILGGDSRSDISGDKTENCWGLMDYWVVKLDAAGAIQWQNTIGGINDDQLRSLHQTTDGGYILGGYSWSTISGDKTENSMGGDDYWLVKLDASGFIQWQNTIGGSGGDFMQGMQKTPDGGYIVGGYSASGISGDKTDFNRGNSDYWVVKVDSSGAIEWQNTTGGSADDFFMCLKNTTDGGCILGGFSFSEAGCDKTENKCGYYDAWVVKLTNKYNLITGKLFLDFNSNQIQDGGEPFVKNKTITETNTNRFSFSQYDGSYKLPVLDSGNFSVFASSIINYYTPVPATHNVYFPVINQTDSLNNFAFQPAGTFNDLCVTISPVSPFRATQNASYRISYENVGTTTLNGTVIFFPDSNVMYVSSDVIPVSVTTDSIVWDAGTLTPFQTGTILVTVQVDAGTPISTLLYSTAEIDPVAGDANTACNYATYPVYVIGAFDPNEILVDRDTVLTTELSSPPYLDYIIYFQNTGNDTAFNVRVLNNIPQMLNVNSFEFVASSHPINITYGAHTRLMTFTFDNILLPDSNVNEPASHGFIRYRIKPNSTLVAGDMINNTAFIYFDFNQPVQTNTAVTEIVLPTGQESFGFQVSGLWLFPNPARDELIVSSKQLKENGTIRIFDLYGRKVFQLETRNQKPETKINVSGFSQGIYFVELQSGDQVLRGKFLKE